MLGVIQLRRGETENCLDCRGPSSCIFPIAAEAVHTNPSGSRAAIGHFTTYLRQRPDDLGVRWLLNVASMTLGEYPERVPAEWRIPIEPFRSRLDIGRFENVATEAGLNVRGPNMAGGSLFDDFNGDGLPDVFTTAFDVELGASLFVNRGDGTFEDRSEAAGLKGQPLAVNAAQADFDNDGRLDIVMVRGGWENAARLTLLRNAGDGRFEDVTVAAGLGEPIASHSAAWGDFDNDGRVDLYVCGEYAASSSAGLFGGDDSLILGDPGTTAGSIATTATGRSPTSPRRPASATTDMPRGRHGATSMTTAISTCTSPTSARGTGCTGTTATGRSPTSPASWG